MTSRAYRFDQFVLRPQNRELRRAGTPIDVSARYFDALVLLVGEAGRLVSKDRFMAEVWRGVPVTDEALTQCIRTLRRALGDDAARPRFIETVPKHGYRFIGAVDEVADSGPGPAGEISAVRRWLLLGGAGTLGAAGAGAIGGLFYGLMLAGIGGGDGIGGASVVLVLLWLTIVAAAAGGAGVSFGIAVAGLLPAPAWRIAGGAGGGFVVGGVAKLLGLDAFNLLLGRAPTGITGAWEGLVLGAAVGLGCWLAHRLSAASLRRGAVMGAIAGAAGGVAVPLLGGRLMAGSLDQLARTFEGSRLQLAPMGQLFGSDGFGPAAHLATGALEGALFGGCIVTAMARSRTGDCGRSDDC